MALAEGVTLSGVIHFVFQVIILSLLINLGILIIFLVIFRKHIKTLLMDIFYNGVLSMIDVGISAFIGGVDIPIVGTYTAFKYWKKKRKVMGTIPTAISFWWAMDLTPISLIPVLGTLISIFTNIVPMMTCLEVKFTKEPKARMEFAKLNSNLGCAQDLKVSMPVTQRNLDDLKKMLETEDYVGCASLGEKYNNTAHGRLKEPLDSLKGEVDCLLQEILRIGMNDDLFDEIDNEIPELKDKVNKAKKDVKAAEKNITENWCGEALKLLDSSRISLQEIKEKIEEIVDRQLVEVSDN